MPARPSLPRVNEVRRRAPSGELPGASAAPAAAAPVTLATLALLFLRIGCTSMGGFMAMVSMTQQVIVERRGLLPAADLLDGLALAMVLPGPVAINVVAYAGYRLRGAAGAAVAMLCAVLPAFLCIVALGTLYFRFGSMDAVRPIFRGITPVIVAIVLAAGCRLWRSTVHDWRQAALGVAGALFLSLVPGLATTLAVMAGSAAAGYGCRRAVAVPDAGRPAAPAAGLPSAKPLHAALAAAALPLAWLLSLAVPAVLLQLTSVFAGMSLLTFGGGYVFIPLLQHTVVDSYHWLDAREFIDGLALTQLSPGPVMISSAFVGLKVAGVAGAAAASAGMFIPSAVLIVVASGAMQRVRHSAGVQAALWGMRAALAGMVFSAALGIARLAEPVWMSALLCVVALVALLRFRADAAWLVACAALVGWLFC